MNKHYNQNYSYSEIKNILEKIHNCIKNDRFLVAQNKNRLENLELIANYKLDFKKQKIILSKIKVEDFCHSLQNNKALFKYETLFVFSPKIYLFDPSNNDKKVLINLYVKFNIIKSKNMVVVISFHKLNKRIKLLFKRGE